MQVILENSDNGAIHTFEDVYRVHLDGDSCLSVEEYDGTVTRFHPEWHIIEVMK